jgi:hypothetical protein
MPKVIKFDLPIDGIRAKNIEEIREHFTLEILDHYRSRLLGKWLAVRKLNTELEALKAIDTSADDQAVFKRLCEIFAVEFDLPLDGIKAKNIEEICEHFTLEILDHYRSRLLGKWLAVRKLNTELEALQAIDTSADDQAVFKRLCEIFAVEADDAVIAVLFNEPAPKFGLTVAEVVKQNETADKIINLAALLPIKAGELKLFTGRALVFNSVNLDGTDLILQSAQGSLIFKSCRITKAITSRFFDFGDGTVLDIKTGKVGKPCGQRYSDFGDGTVLDIRTGLHWMRCALGQTWTGKTCNGEAKNYQWNTGHRAVAELNNSGGYAGHCDWRLPSIDELKTLVYCSSGQPKTWNDTGKPCKGYFNQPTIDLTAFPNTPSSFFWSGSPNANRLDVAWVVVFGNGSDSSCVSRDKGCYPVRLVRGGQCF